MLLLKGKKAVVTGGTRGIGYAIAQSFVKQGAEVAILGMNLERGEKIASHLNEISDKSGNVKFFAIDVKDFLAVKQFSEKIQEMWGGIDILVNCAGITKDQLLMKMSESDWDEVLATNLKSVYNMSHVFIRGMVKKRIGRIVNVSSVVGLTGNAGQANYAASKAGMIGFSKSLAKEVASRNVTVNCVAPGFIKTDMTDQLNEQQKKAILARVPMGRLGEAKEVADVVVFLASDQASFITGQTFTIDGGMTT